MNHLSKLTTIPATIIAALTFAGVAHANPSTASATCEGGIVYSGHDYPPSGNTVTIVIDGAIVKTVTYGTSTSGNVANPDKTKPHSWFVIWDRANGTDGDRTQQGTMPACETAPTTTAAPTTTVGASSVPVVTITAEVVTPVVTPAPALLAVDVPPVPQPQQGVSAAGQTLPQTGVGAGGLIWAAALVAAGFIALFVSRRRVRP
jgi:LPXTG-motif cell wall-anchored protein